MGLCAVLIPIVDFWLVLLLDVHIEFIELR